MEKVTLRFHSKEELLEFLAHTGAFRCTIDLEHFTVNCSLTEADLELATNGYHARVEKEA